MTPREARLLRVVRNERERQRERERRRDEKPREKRSSEKVCAGGAYDVCICVVVQERQPSSVEGLTLGV